VSSTAFSNKILYLIVAPATGTTTYKVALTETTSGYVFKKAGSRTLTGTNLISFASGIPIVNDTYTIDITAASVDELFNFDVRYI